MSRFDAATLARAAAAVRASLAQPPGPVPPPAPPAAPAQPDALQLAAALCRRFEGLRLRPYLCPAGVPTIGYGSTRYADGTAVRLTDPAISQAQAEALLLLDLRTVRLPAVRRLCPGVDTPGRLAALIDFAYNLGVGNLSASTLRRRVNAGDWPAVPAELRRWVRAAGVVLPGLVARREAEVRLV